MNLQRFKYTYYQELLSLSILACFNSPFVSTFPSIITPNLPPSKGDRGQSYRMCLSFCHPQILLILDYILIRLLLNQYHCHLQAPIWAAGLLRVIYRNLIWRFHNHCWTSLSQIVQSCNRHILHYLPREPAMEWRDFERIDYLMNTYHLFRGYIRLTPSKLISCTHYS